MPGWRPDVHDRQPARGLHDLVSCHLVIERRSRCAVEACPEHKVLRMTGGGILLYRDQTPIIKKIKYRYRLWPGCYSEQNLSLTNDRAGHRGQQYCACRPPGAPQPLIYWREAAYVYHRKELLVVTGNKLGCRWAVLCGDRGPGEEGGGTGTGEGCFTPLISLAASITHPPHRRASGLGGHELWRRPITAHKGLPVRGSSAGPWKGCWPDSRDGASTCRVCIKVIGISVSVVS